MNTKEKFLQQLSRQKPVATKKLHLSAMSDLEASLEERDWDMLLNLNDGKVSYDEALTDRDNYQESARVFAEEFDYFTRSLITNKLGYEKAIALFNQVSSQLEDLGIEAGPRLQEIAKEMSSWESEIAEGEQGKENDFPDMSEFNLVLQ